MCFETSLIPCRHAESTFFNLLLQFEYQTQTCVTIWISNPCFFDDLWHFSLFFLLESSRYSRKHIFSFFSKTLFCLLTAWFDHDFFGFKTTFCWICTSKIKKYFFEKKRCGKLWWHKRLSFSRFFNFFSKIVIVLWFWSYFPLTTAFSFLFFSKIYTTDGCS